MAQGQHVPSSWRTFRATLPREAAIAELARRQHGVVSLAQLRHLGISPSAVRNRVAAGRLHRIYRGVYAVGHPRLTGHGRWMAATLACGPGALLSHRSAAALWGIRKSVRPKTDITLPSRSVRARTGIDLRGSLTLTDADLALEDGIPCTSVARTLVDLSDVVDRRGLERAVEQAEVLRRFDLRAVEAALSRAGRRRGAGMLRRVLAELSGPSLTESELEELFLALCRSVSLPRPEVAAWIVLDDGAAVKADFLWRPEKLIVETDSHKFHSSREAFEEDRLRDQRLMLEGIDVLRFTWRHIVHESERVARTIAQVHADRRAMAVARLARP